MYYDIEKEKREAISAGERALGSLTESRKSPDSIAQSNKQG